MKKNEDEHGTEWVVMAHDPASSLVNKLHREGLTHVVLPRIMYRLGQIPELLPPCADYLRSVRMADCLELLK